MLARPFKSDTHRLLFLSVFTFVLYSNTLWGTFNFDDRNVILQNPNIRLTKLDWQSIAKAGFGNPSPNRPVAKISFALNYYFHGYRVLGYHLVNIFIHILSGVFFYLFLQTTVDIPSLGESHSISDWIPFFAVLLWLVHPIQTQSVAYIVQRMNSMAAMFYMLSLWLYAKARLTATKKRKATGYALCIFSGILALGTKEISATLPVFIFLYEWYFFQNLSRLWLKKHFIFLAGTCLIFAIMVFVYMGGHPFEKVLSGYIHRNFTLTERLLTQFRVVVFYISLLLYPRPTRLNLDHDYLLSRSLIDPPTTLLGMGAIFALIWMGIYLAKKDRLLSFCIIWYFGNLVIESSFIPLEIIFEHRNYLPSMLFSLLIVLLADRYIGLKGLRYSLLGAAVILCTVWTVERNRIWGDNIALWTDCVKKSPKKIRPHNNLGVLLINSGRITGAIRHFSIALELNPDDAETHNNLGNTLSDQGNYDEAIDHYKAALRIKPGYAEARNNLGNVLVNQGRFKEAAGHFYKALEINPDNSDVHFNLGNTLIRLGEPESAIRHFSEAVRINPEDSGAHYNLGNALMRQGQAEKAIPHYSEALRIRPRDVKVHSRLGLALAKAGNLEGAIRHFSKVLKFRPDSASAHYNIGFALAEKGDSNGAIHHFSETLRINPNHTKAHHNLGIVLARKGNLKEAIHHFREALRIQPDFIEAKRSLELGLRLLDGIKGTAKTDKEP